jgi:hypothetical protein
VAGKNYFNLSYIKSKDNLAINKALLTDKHSNFSVTILEYCDISDLHVKEQYYFDKLDPQYNRLKNNKARISKSLKGINETNKSSSIKYSEDIKLKMSTISGNPINIYEKFTSKGFKLIGSFVSARRAGKFLDISGSTVIKYKNSGEIFKDRYKFSSK